MTVTLYELVGREGKRYSPYCWRTRMALAHKGLSAAYESCRHNDWEKLGFTGQIKVPVLVDGSTVVTDSWRIACYLDDAYPERPPLMNGSQDRAVTKFLNEWANSKIDAPILRSLLLDIRENLHPDVDAEDFRKTREARFGATLEALRANRERDFEELNVNLAPLEALLRDQPWVCGGSPGYGDYIIFGSFQFPECLSGIEVLQNKVSIARWRDAARGLFDNLGGRAY